MVVCHCKAVTDADVRAAVARGARHLLDLRIECDAGRTCGGCGPALRRLLHEAQAEAGRLAGDAAAVA